MTRLSVNLNKIALLRNSRGENRPDLVQFALDCEDFGAMGITVHPRPDERHVTFDDSKSLKKEIKTELNIEGYPDDRFFKILESAHPAQATLVPDKPDALTSDSGWNIFKEKDFLKDVVARVKSLGIRCSLFIDPDPKIPALAKEVNADRIELYTKSYADLYSADQSAAIKPYIQTAKEAVDCALEINAGHDLNLNNLNFFVKNIEKLDEVSIGHALIIDALYYGIENTIKMYLHQLKK